MSGNWIEFLFYRGPSFVGAGASFEEADYAAFGVPFDATASYRPGSRFGPLSLRVASEYLELPAEKMIRLCDLGDLHPTNSVEVMLRRVGEAVERIEESGRIPVIIGGEHTLTLGSASRLRSMGCLVILDAHLDMRDEFMDTKINHTTWLRRLLEERRIERVIVAGARAYVDEESSAADEMGIHIITSTEIFLDLRGAMKKLEALTSGLENIYLSIDVDVLDPGYAPGVSNPEPGGIAPIHLYELIKLVAGKGLAALDIVEVNPLFDDGSAAACAVYAAYYAMLSSTTSS
ncbi:MAG: agmatinase [Nitrososphaerota archaeon]